MDFFNDIGKRVSNAAKTVQKRTRESAEIGKLNSGMRALKNERAKLFASLGETYYGSLTSGEGAEQMEFIVEQLNQLAEKETALQAQIDKLSQQKRCPQCGSVVPFEANFCPKCGERMPVEEPAPVKADEPTEKEYCPNCGALRQENSAFCIVCGKPFGQAADAREPEDAPQAEAPREPQRIQMEIKWPRAEEQSEPEDEAPEDGPDSEA